MAESETEIVYYLDCTMDGFVGAVEECVENFLFFITLSVTLLLGYLPTEGKMAGCYVYSFVLAAPAFTGYVLAAAYFVAADFGYGAPICDFLQPIWGEIFMAFFDILDTIEGMVSTYSLAPETDEALCSVTEEEEAGDAAAE